MNLPPRNRLHGTRAEQLLRKDFYRVYLQARFEAAEDKELPNASSVFTDDGIVQLRTYVSQEALSAPVVLTERLSNRTLAVHLVQNAVERFVVVNVRIKVDPDVLTHALVEECVHSQQVLDQIDFEEQRCRYPYMDRPYEVEAKRIATEVMGYDPENYDAILIRDEHSSEYYDVSLPARG